MRCCLHGVVKTPATATKIIPDGSYRIVKSDDGVWAIQKYWSFMGWRLSSGAFECEADARRTMERWIQDKHKRDSLYDKTWSPIEKES